uniref:GTP-binding protein n=1 Tax=Kwoniella bestiolae CBS 10118 TaxID=1296100 RepID=A0A1B9GGH6_9TREE|nr:Gtr1/RagA G protein Gtr1 [Kwoniella bestiolae CBS 10118]OCF30163.1 Gtr1/RagA G protein Gtr1 [Kwoniella bestiolae CBS 10118]
MSTPARKKVLLMGKSGSGKTSMRSVIFSNYTARDTRRLGATIDVEQSAVRFLGGLVLNLWDCGGQNAFVDNYLSSQKDTIFSNVAVLIYVFDITSNEWDGDLRYFEDILFALRENSPEAGVWVLINKMDLIDKEDPQRKKFKERKADLLRVDESVREELKDESIREVLRCFPTSIWDESLYKAWSSIIHTLIPNISLITSHLTYLRDLCLAVEAVLFEADTFLVIAKSGSPLDSRELDQQRFEKISEIVKGFKKTCSRNHEQYHGFEAKFNDCTVILEPLTKNTYIMIVSVDPRVETGALLYNVHQSSAHMVEFATKHTLEVQKCGICRHNKELKYDVQGDEDDSIAAWDDPRP